MGKSTNRTSHQVQTDDANNRLFRSAFKAAHKAATTAYAASVKAGKQRGQGFSAKAIATKYDATLSDDNPHRITALALINWQKKQKKPGGSPTLPGPKVSKAKAALIEVMITFSQSSQLEGKTQRPSELMAKMTAAVEETAHAHLVSSEQKRSRLLSSVRKDGRITSGQGESIEERRMEALTEENYKRWFDGWEGFLIKRQFGVKMMHPELSKEMVYVSKQKRARIIQPDETHQVMTTEMEKGGPRARASTLTRASAALGAPWS
jgi:hypothetical protein